MRVQLEEELIVDERLDWLFVVIEGKHIVDEGEVEGLIPQVAIDRLLITTSYARSYARSALTRSRGILALPQFKFDIEHVISIEVALKLEVLIIIKAIEGINAVFSHLILVGIVKR
jgi:hypothetical protein